MKKLLTSVIASAALLLGFASCSGDLHDNSVQPLTVTGLCGTQVVPFTIPEGGDGSEQELTFKFAEDTKLVGLDGKEKALKDGWGQDKGFTTPQLKIVPQTALDKNYEPNWSMDFGGARDTNLYAGAGSDYIELDYRGKNGNTNPGNIFLDGLVMNETYTLRIKYNAGTNSVQFKVEGSSSNPAAMNFVIDGESKNFPAGKTYSMDKSGPTYTYSFISKADETIKFQLKNDLAGTFGFDADAAVPPDGDDKGNPTTPLVLDGKGFLTVDAKKDVEYKITVSAPSITSPKVKGEVVSLLYKAKLNGNFKYAENFYEVDCNEQDSTKGFNVPFQAVKSDLEFTVIRHDGSVWGKDNKDLSLSDSDSTTLKYGSSSTPIKISGLTIGSWYNIKLTQDAANVKVNAKVELLTTPVLNNKATRTFMWSNVNNSSWGQDTDKYGSFVGFPEFLKVEDKENSYYAKFSPVDKEVEFGLRFTDITNANNQLNWIGMGAEIKELDKEVESCYVAADKSGNSKITNLEPNKKYTLYVTFKDPAHVTLKVVEEK